MQGRPPGRLRHSYSARCRLVRLVLSGLSPQAASTACGMSRATAYRLLRRYQQEGGWDALRDRPPIAKHHPRRLSAEAEAQIVELRRRTGWGPGRCRQHWGGPPRRSGGCSGGMTAHEPSVNRGRRRIGMSTPWSVSSSISISSSWAASGRSANAYWETATAARAPAGATPTSPSMTTPAPPPSNCAPASTPPTASASPPM